MEAGGPFLGLEEEDTMSRTYISGPMTGIPGHNFEAFHSAARRLRNLGREVCNPAELDAGITDKPWEWFLKRDLGYLVLCDEVAVLPRWQFSKGARLEVYVARALGMPILDSRTLLPWGTPAKEWTGALVGVLGYARSGKDTAVEQLGWPRAAFADELKADLAMLFQNIGADPSDPELKKLLRPVMVEAGRAGRAVDPATWINRLYLPPECAALADCRYVNECEWVIGKGGLLVWVQRPGYGPANDEENQSFMAIERWSAANVVPIPRIANDGTIERLGERVKAVVGRWYTDEPRLAA